MQRPNFQEQIHGKIVQDLKNGIHNFAGGWQQSHPLNDRVARIMQLVSQLRLINTDVSVCLAIAQKWELRTFEETQNKEQYAEKMELKLNEIRQRRNQQAGAIPLGAGGMMPNQMGNNGMMRPGKMMGGGMPNMQNMQNMGNMQNMSNMNGMNGMGFPNNTMAQQQNLMNGQNPMFPAQLARPMQPSPVNMPGQAGTLDPSALQMPAQAQARQQQQQQQHQQLQQSQQQQQNSINQTGQQQMANMGPGGQAQPSAMIAQRARQMYDKMPEDQKQAARNHLINSMPESQRQQARQRGDPLMQFCYRKAQMAYEEQRRQQMAGQQNAGMAANGNNLNMQINGSNNGNNKNGQQPSSQGSGPNFDVSGILGQQANALKLQDAGEQVVPASNNNTNNFNMGLGNQMNQNINPQMLGNQGQGGNNAMNPQQAAFYNQQRNAQQQERLQKQMLAQQHALQSARMQQQQQNQLTGQPGGLHAPNAFAPGVGGQVPSPAMSMLNRPMVPPGQATPGTPQPNRQQPMGQLPMNGASQLLQHHQSMLNQNNHQQGQQGSQIFPPHINAMLQRVPPEFRDKLARMPPGDMQAMLMKMGAQRQQSSANQSNQMTQPGMPGMQQQNVPPSQNMLQQQMGNVVPGFNSQPAPNKQNMQMNNQAAVLQRNQQQQTLLRIRQQIMDSKTFPRQVLTMLSISVPPQVQKWQELRQHVAQNGSVVPPQTLERIQQMQQQWYAANPQEVNGALQAYIAQQRRTQDQAQNGQQPQANNMQQQASTGNPQAPPAQMVPPAPMMQMPTPNVTSAGDAPQQPIPPQMHAQVLRMITADDIQKFRAALGPRAQGMNDDQIRQFLANQRIEKWRSAQRAAQQGQRPPGQTAQMPRQAQANMSSISEAHQRTSQSGMPAGQKSAQPVSDDVVEISNPAMQQQAPQAPPMQASHSQQRIPTQEQLAQMTPQQKTAWMQKRQQMEALRKAQGGVTGANSGMTGPQGDLVQKLSNMMKEIQQATPKGPPINYDAQGQERVRALLQRLWKPVLQMSTTFPAALNWGLEQQLRDLIRTKLILQQNAKDELGSMRDYYSVTMQQLQDMEKSIGTYMTEFKSTQMRHQTQKSGSAKEPPTHAPSMATATSQQGHARKNSNMRAPPAPTDDKKFDWSAQSPGVPMYAQDQPGLTQDKLKFPPQKKRKPNQAGSQVSTPAAQVGTPATAGASPALANMKGQQSPEQARRAQQQLRADAERAQREAEARKFRCKDSSCEHSLQGFDTEAQLDEHAKAQHQPVPNPLDFFLENASTALELDSHGVALPKPDVPATKVAASRVKPRLTVRDLKPEELTKLELDQIQKNFVSPSVKQKLARKQAEVDAASEKEKEAVKEPTMRDAMCKKLDISLPTMDSVAADVDVSTADTFDLDLAGYDTYGLDIFGMDANQMTLESIQEMANMGTNWEPVDGNLSSWRLRDDSDLTNSSPELTPDGSQSSSSSDVRETDTMRFVLGVENDAWDAWGTGENLVAERMIPMYTQIKQMLSDGANVNSNGDTELKESEGASPKKRKAIEDVWDVPVQDFLNNDFFGGEQN